MWCVQVGGGLGFKNLKTNTGCAGIIDSPYHGVVLVVGAVLNHLVKDVESYVGQRDTALELLCAIDRGEKGSAKN